MASQIFTIGISRTFYRSEAKWCFSAAEKTGKQGVMRSTVNLGGGLVDWFIEHHSTCSCTQEQEKLTITRLLCS